MMSFTATLWWFLLSAAFSASYRVFRLPSSSSAASAGGGTRRHAPLYVTQVARPTTTVDAVETSFRRMVRRFQNYSDADIGSLASERLRLLLLGGREALLTEPAVVAAFEVLYEDVLPVRFGGDILFNLIDKAVVQARRERSPSLLHAPPPPPAPAFAPAARGGPCVRGTSKAIIQGVLASFKAQQEGPLSSSPPALCGESLFAEIDRNGDGVLCLEEFNEWVASVPLEVDARDRGSGEGWFCVPTLFQALDANSDGVLTLEEFQLWTTGSLDDAPRPQHHLQQQQHQHQHQLHQDVVAVPTYATLADIPLTHPAARKHRDRFFHMLEAFSEWEGRIHEVPCSTSCCVFVFPL
jgi:hypothetical protein